MNKLYAEILIFIILAIFKTANVSAYSSKLEARQAGPEDPLRSLKKMRQQNAINGITTLNVLNSNGNLDTGKSKPVALKDTRSSKPSLIFSAPTFPISNRLLFGAPQAVSLSELDNQYKISFVNLSVSSPVHDQLSLSYSLAKDNVVTAKIFNVLGSEVTTLFSEYQLAGEQHKVLSLADRIGSGIYILKLSAGNDQMAKRIQVL